MRGPTATTPFAAAGLRTTAATPRSVKFRLPSPVTPPPSTPLPPCPPTPLTSSSSRSLYNTPSSGPFLPFHLPPTPAPPSISLAHLNYGFIKECGDRGTLEGIVKVLTTEHKDKFPSLLEVANKRLRDLSPSPSPSPFASAAAAAASVSFSSPPPQAAFAAEIVPSHFLRFRSFEAGRADGEAADRSCVSDVTQGTVYEDACETGGSEEGEEEGGKGGGGGGEREEGVEEDAHAHSEEALEDSFVVYADSDCGDGDFADPGSLETTEALQEVTSFPVPSPSALPVPVDFSRSPPGDENSPPPLLPPPPSPPSPPSSPLRPASPAARPAGPEDVTPKARAVLDKDGFGRERSAIAAVAAGGAASGAASSEAASAALFSSSSSSSSSTSTLALHHSSVSCLVCPRLQRKLLQTVPRVVVEAKDRELTQAKEDLAAFRSSRVELLTALANKDQETRLVTTTAATAATDITLLIEELRGARLEAAEREREKDGEIERVRRELAVLEGELVLAKMSKKQNSSSSANAPSANAPSVNVATSAHLTKKVASLESELDNLVALKLLRDKKTSSTVSGLTSSLEETNRKLAFAEAAAVACRLEIEGLVDQTEMGDVVIAEIKEKEREAEKKAEIAIKAAAEARAECDRVAAELNGLLEQERSSAKKEIERLQNSQVVPFSNDRVVAKNAELVRKLEVVRAALRESRDEVEACKRELSGCAIAVTGEEREERGGAERRLQVQQHAAGQLQRKLDEWRGRERLYVDEISTLHKQLELQGSRVSMGLYKMALEEAGECEARARERGEELEEVRGRMADLERDLRKIARTGGTGGTCVAAVAAVPAAAPAAAAAIMGIQKKPAHATPKRERATAAATPRSSCGKTRSEMTDKLKAARTGKSTPLADRTNRGTTAGFLKSKSPLLQTAFLASKQRKLFRKGEGGDGGATVTEE